MWPGYFFVEVEGIFETNLIFFFWDFFQMNNFVKAETLPTTYILGRIKKDLYYFTYFSFIFYYIYSADFFIMVHGESCTIWTFSVPIILTKF